MIPFYLYLNSAFYLIFAAWCLIKPVETANSLGYSFLSNSGKVEYSAVYIGMELGFATFLALCGLYPKIRLAGLLFCVCMYIGLIIIRTASALIYGNVSKIIYVIGGLEYILGIWGIILLVGKLKELE
ncbi:MAG: hypothetical protein V4608_04715 [Bacteroidota bacterium]